MRLRTISICQQLTIVSLLLICCVTSAFAQRPKHELPHPVDRDGAATPAVNLGPGLFGFGNNLYGNLGDGTDTLRSSPTLVPGMANAVAVSAGLTFTLALKSDGTVWSWGDNSTGQLGNGTLTRSANPAQIAGLANVVAISASGVINAQSPTPISGFGLALESNGTLWAWGDNQFGQLGDGTTTQRTTPVQVSGLTSVVAIAASDMFSMALLSDGTVWAWGDNSLGELGDGTTTSHIVPARIKALSGIVSIAGGGDTTFNLEVSGSSTLDGPHGVALQANGEVWTWGAGLNGQIGNGSTANQPTPAAVPSLSNVTAISAGELFVEVVGSGGNVLGFGDDTYGELGDGGAAASVLTPTTAKVSAAGHAPLSGIVSVACGGLHTIALSTTGAVFAWGYDSEGQLGDGQSSTTSTIIEDYPVQPIGLSGVTQVTAGSDFSLALVPTYNTVVGTIDLSGYEGTGAGLQRVTFLFRPVSSGVAQIRSALIRPGGVYSLTNVLPGVYNIAIKGDRWLQTVVSNVAIEGTAVVDATLIPGDLNGDNVVDISDFSVLASAFGSSIGSATWNPVADLNGDGVVDISDFSLLATNFGAAGNP